jgi:hypothetical protein
MNELAKFQHRGIDVTSRTTVIAETECPCCGKAVRIYVDKNLRAYQRCAWPDNETLAVCGHRVHYSAKESLAMLDALAASRKPKGKQNGPKNEPEEIDNPPAQLERKRAAGGGLFG